MATYYCVSEISWLYLLTWRFLNWFSISRQALGCLLKLVIVNVVKWSWRFFKAIVCLFCCLSLSSLVVLFKEMCVPWLLNTVWEQAQHLWCSLIWCGASAGCSSMSRNCGGFCYFFSPTKWSSALSFAVSCTLGCSSHWRVNALFQLLKWKHCTLCVRSGCSVQQLLCRDSTEHYWYRPAAATGIELSQFLWGERSGKKKVFKENVALS